MRFIIAALCLVVAGHGGVVRAGENVAPSAGELGHPVFREFAPGRDQVGYLNQAIMQDRDGFMYSANHSTIRVYDGTVWRPIVTPAEAAGVRRFDRTDDGTIYVGGLAMIGYLRGTGLMAEYVSLADRLPPSELGCDEIHEVCAAGPAVYFADEEKILRWQDGAFTLIPCRAPPHSRATRLHRVGGEVYVTSPGRPLHRIVADRLEPVADAPVLREDTVILMEPDGAGGLRLLTAAHGFYHCQDGRVSRQPSAADHWLAGKTILRATRMHGGELAVIFTSVSGAGGMRFDAAGRYVGPLDQTLGVYSKSLRDVFCDREDGLWLGVMEGIFRIEWPSAVTVFDVVNGLGTEGVIALERRADGLYATTTEGAFRLRPMDAQGRIARFELVTEPSGPKAEARKNESWVECPAAEPAGARWVARENEIVLRARDGQELRRLPQLAVRSAGAVRVLREEDSPAGPVLWIGGALGLVRVEVARTFPPPVPFGAILTATGVREGDRLPPEHRPLRFDYVALRLQLPEAVAYQTRLLGFEREWTEWTSERARSFTRLAPGAYRFEVRTRDYNGVIGTPALLTFVVRPHWWFSWWAITGYIAVGGGAMAAYIRLRTRALRSRAERLEAIVVERTTELARQNTELVRLNQLELDEKISAKLGEEKARLEMLRYQLNPHFLFNTLTSISGALGGAHPTARAMVERLTDFCRLTLHRNNDRDWTTLGEDMKLLRAYLDIEQSRWGDLLDVRIECGPELADEPIPHFLLLPLVENALKYGHATSVDRVGIRLTARREADGALIIEVANTGEWLEPGRPKAVNSLGIGLENLRERLRRYYPRRHELGIFPGAGWVTVSLRIARAVPS